MFNQNINPKLIIQKKEKNLNFLLKVFYFNILLKFKSNNEDLIISSCHHHSDKLLIINVPIPIDISLANHFIDLLIS